MNRRWLTIVAAMAVTLLTAEKGLAQVGAVFSGVGHPRLFVAPVGGFFPYAPFGLGFPSGYGYPFGYGSFGYSYGYFGMYSAPTYSYTYTYVSAPPRSAYTQSHAAPSPVTSRTALIEVRVPADAEVSFNGETTSETGTLRTFRSKPLQDDTIYTFEVKASWKENDKPVERTRKVRLQAGEEIRISLLNP